MSFLGLLTRCKDEFFIEEFCNYYLSQGVDKIFIIDDNSNNKTIYKNLLDNDKIVIHYKKNIVKNHKINGDNSYVNKVYQQIKNDFKWMIYCDADEFITTKKNIDNTIKDELINTFKDVDCIKIPWVMMSCNGRKNNPKSILIENLFRWNHNLTHPHKIHKFRCRYNKIEVKCIFKTDKFIGVTNHFPIKNSESIIIVDSININKENSAGYYKNLREDDIKNGYMLCYHYRIISIENCMNKLKNSFIYKNKYTLEDLLDTDYPEIKDETLKQKYLKLL